MCVRILAYLIVNSKFICSEVALYDFRLNEGLRRIEYFKNYSTGDYTRRISMKET